MDFYPQRNAHKNVHTVHHICVKRVHLFLFYYGIAHTIIARCNALAWNITRITHLFSVTVRFQVYCNFRIILAEERNAPLNVDHI